MTRRGKIAAATPLALALGLLSAPAPSMAGAPCCAAAENIAYARGSSATPRTIFGLWMNSAGHRRNILGSYRDIGIGMEVGTLDNAAGAHVWTQEFGSRDC